MKKAMLAGVVALALGGAMVSLPAIAATATISTQHHHRHHHGHGHFDAALQRLHADLHLDARQEQHWQRIRAHQRALHQLLREHRHYVRQVMNAELAKPQPNMARIAAAQDQGRHQLRARRRAIRNDMLAFYAHLSPQQKSVVRDALVARRNRMREWQQSHRHQRGVQKEQSGKTKGQGSHAGNALDQLPAQAK